MALFLKKMFSSVHKKLQPTFKAWKGLEARRNRFQRVLVTFVRYKSDTLVLSRKQNSLVTIILPPPKKI